MCEGDLQEGVVLPYPLRGTSTIFALINPNHVVDHQGQTCRQVYCPSHRFPSDHTCTPPQSRLLAPSSSSSSSKPTSATAKRPSATGQSDTDKALKAVNAKATNAVSNVKKAAAAGSSSVAAKASAVAAVAPGMVKAKKTDR